MVRDGRNLSVYFKLIHINGFHMSYSSSRNAQNGLVDSKVLKP